MNLSDFLHQRFPGSFQGMQIRTWLMQSREKGYQLLHSLLIQALGEDTDENFEIATVVPACAKLGIFTASDLNQFSQDPLNDRFFPGIRAVTEAKYPRLAWEGGLRKEFNHFALTEAVKQSGFRLASNFHVHIEQAQDAWHRILPMGAGCLRELLEQSKVKYYRHLAERRDCDDRALMFQAELAKAGRGDMAIRYLEFSCYDAGDKLLYRHALNFSVHEKADPTKPALAFFMIDPQFHDPITAIWNSPDRVPVYMPGQVRIEIDAIRL